MLLDGDDPPPALRPGLPSDPDDAPAAMTAQQRLELLIAANRSILGELSLPGVIRRIVEAGPDLVGARYAALAVLGADGSLADLRHNAMPPSLVAAIVERPPARTEQGLVVPIRTRGAVFGHLHLVDRVASVGRPSAGFTPEDEQLALALAATAGIAVENAGHDQESRRRQGWLRASGEVSRQLLAGDGGELDTLRQIAVSVARLAAADLVAIVLPATDGSAAPGLAEDGTQHDVVAAHGQGASELVGRRYHHRESIAWQAMSQGRGLRLSGVDRAGGVYARLQEITPVREIMALPLQGEHRPRGAIVAARTRAHGFGAADLDMAGAFAAQAAIALELADARRDQQRLTVLEERDRIARDLHDHVIQRLFAAGLSVQSAAGSVSDPELGARLARAVVELDETIQQVRTSIFALQEAPTRSLRGSALDVLEQLAPALAVRPTLQLVGPLDTVADDGVVADVEAVVRESLTNVARHAQASRIRVRIETDRRQLVVTVVDDGVGLAGSTRRSGLANLRRRAEARSGHLQVADGPQGGLRLRWRIAL